MDKRKSSLKYDYISKSRKSKQNFAYVTLNDKNLVKKFYILKLFLYVYI